MICISIGNSGHIPLVNKLKPEYAELRYDLLNQRPEDVMHKISKRIRQVSTCRPGLINEQDRLGLLCNAIELGTYYVDVEIESAADFVGEIRKACNKFDSRMIISYHNFDKTPSESVLKTIIEKSVKLGADTVKIACTVHDKKDVSRLLGLYESEGSKIIIGMGRLGRITRLAALQLGAPFTFAAATEDETTAPGQLTYNELVSLQNTINRP